jgi:ELWxxDGT repeat protein
MNASSLRHWRHCLRTSRNVGCTARARRWRQSLSLEALEERITLSLTPQMLLDINPGAASSNPSGMVVIGSTTYFSANDGIDGSELWKSDGTAAGTTLVKDIYPGSSRFYDYYGNRQYLPNSSYPRNLTNVNGTLFFTSGYGLWKSDGTGAGTVMVNSGSAWSDPGNLTNVNGTLLFSAYDGTHRYELWKSDGTVGGTTLVKDIYPGSHVEYYTGYFGGTYSRVVISSSNPSELTNFNGTLFFTATNDTNGRELWRSDGTEAGTTLVKDIHPGGFTGFFGGYYPNSSGPQGLTNVAGTLFFRALNATSGYELWKSDGTAAHTALVKDVNTGGASSYPSNLTNVNGVLFFSAEDYSASGGRHGRELWKSDGTTAGTTLVKDIHPGGALNNYGNYIPYGSAPSSLRNVNGTLFFTADDGTHGLELWKSDGTAAGTTLVKDITPGSASSSPGNLTNVNGKVFFTANDGTGVWKLWQSDGTAVGTVLVANLFSSSLTNVNGTLYFSADDGVHGQELWKLVDSPTQGTSLKVTGFPANITAGVASNFTVSAKNADGSTNTSYLGTVHFTSSDPQAVLPANYTFSAADQGVHTFSATLKTAGSQSITTGDTVVPSGAGTQSGITVTPAATSRFTVAGFPSPVTAGVAGSLTVTAWDAYGNRATGYRGTVRFTSSDAKAVLPGNYIFTTADAGLHTFSAVLKTAGTQSLTATDTASAAIAGTQSVTVNPAKASRLVVSAPASVKAGAKFSLTVTVVDAYGNVVTGYRGTMAFRSSDSKARLPRNYTFTAADQGVHTFTGLVLKKRANQTITVTDTLDSSLTASVLIDVR